MEGDAETVEIQERVISHSLERVISHSLKRVIIQSLVNPAS
jgi:hypothetical protein